MQNWMKPLECALDSFRKWTTDLPHTSKHPYISVALAGRGVVLQYCLAHCSRGRKSHFMGVIEAHHPRKEKIHMPCSASRWLAAVWPRTRPAGGHSEWVGAAFLTLSSEHGNGARTARSTPGTNRPLMSQKLNPCSIQLWILKCHKNINKRSKSTNSNL